MLAPALGELDQAFQYIQEYTGFISPGVVAIFLFGFFYKKTSANAAFWVVILAIPISIAMKFGFSDMPFMDRMGISFILCCLILIILSHFDNKGEDDDKSIKIEKGLFGTDLTFNIGALLIAGMLAVIYTLFY